MRPDRGKTAMCAKETAKEFLRRHNMLYEQQPFEALTDAYISDMRAGLRGDPF